jgi:copper resistance protein C
VRQGGEKVERKHALQMLGALVSGICDLDWRSTMIARLAIALLLALTWSFIHGAALAHSHLTKSVPAAGATVAAGPSEVRLQFNEAVEPRFSKISVEPKGGKPIALEPPTSDPADKTTLIVKFAEPLQAGSYKVNWQAVSADTHKVKGTFTFEVRP